MQHIRIRNTSKLSSYFLVCTALPKVPEQAAGGPEGTEKEVLAEQDVPDAIAIEPFPIRRS